MPHSNAIAAAVAPVAESITASVPVSVTARQSWYAINNKAGPQNEAEITIYDAIGAFGITAEQFVTDLKQIDAERIRLRLNTPGGEIFDATAIYNALREHPAKIIAQIDGIAASAGSVIAMSGDEIRMADNSYMMIHNAHGGVMGDVNDVSSYASSLKKIDQTIAATYAKRTGKGADHYLELMAAETWFTAAEAKDEGLADVVFEAAPAKATAKAHFDFKVYNKIPDPVRKLWGLPRLPKMIGPDEEVVQVPPQQINSPAPEDSRRSDPPPANTKETAPMSESNQAAPAPTPAAPSNGPVPQGPPASDPRKEELARLQNVTNEGHFNQGKIVGQEDGRKAEMKRLDAILAVCPDKAMALDSFKAGHAPETAKLLYDHKLDADNRANEMLAAKELEITRMRAQMAAGGYPGGVPTGAGAGDESGEEPEQLDAATAKARAEREWDHKPGARKGFSSKENYVNVRTAEMMGRFRMSQAAATTN